MTDQHNPPHSVGDEVSLDAYSRSLLEDAKRFDINALERADRMVKRMSLMTLGFCVVTVASVIVAIVATMDVREVQPYVLVKDENAGTVTELVKVEPQEWTQGTALDAAYLAQYVRSREEFSDAQVGYNYEQVELMSTGPVLDEYMRWIDPEANRLSPLALYPKGVVDIEITGVVRMSQGAAQVHYKRLVKGVPSAPRPASFIATVEFSYLTKNMTLGARLRNPMGFTVSSYNVDESVVGTTVQPGSGGAPRQ